MSNATEVPVGEAESTTIVSWNVNGLRAVVPKLPNQSLKSLFEFFNADVICFQETKADSKQLLGDSLVHVDGYESFWSFCTIRKGYSGTATFVRKGKTVAASVTPFGDPIFDSEGRVVMTDHKQFVLFNVYFPNTGKGEDRVAYKMKFQNRLFEIVGNLVKSGRDVIVVGDYNVAHQDFDIWRPPSKPVAAGTLPSERQWFDNLTRSGYFDTFRHLHPIDIKYTWWDMKLNQRAVNNECAWTASGEAIVAGAYWCYLGWRIDYCVANDRLKEHIKAADVWDHVLGSDHCPVSVTLDFALSINSSAPLELSSDYQRKKQANIMSFFGATAVPKIEKKVERAGRAVGAVVKDVKRPLDAVSISSQEEEPPSKKQRTESAIDATAPK